MSGSDQKDSHRQSIAACNCLCEAVSQPLPAYACSTQGDTKLVVVRFLLTHKPAFSMLVAEKSSVLSAMCWPNRRTEITNWSCLRQVISQKQNFEQ